MKKNKSQQSDELIYLKKILKSSLVNYASFQKKIIENIISVAKNENLEAVPTLAAYAAYTNIEIRIFAIASLEKMGQFDVIPHSGLPFPGVLTKNEISACLKYIDTVTLKTIASVWNPAEKHQILSAVDRSERKKIFSKLHQYIWLDSMLNLHPEKDEFSKSMSFITDLISLLSRAGDITSAQSTDAVPKKVSLNLYIKAIRDERKGHAVEYISVQKKVSAAIESCAKNIHEFDTNPDTHAKLLLALNEASRRLGLLCLEDYIGSINTDIIKNGLQMICDGISPDVVRIILKEQQSRIIHEYDSLLTMITGSLLLMQEGIMDSSLKNYMYSLYPSLSKD